MADELNESKGNALFMVIESEILGRLQQEGFCFYCFPVEESLKDDMKNFKNPERSALSPVFIQKRRYRNGVKDILKYPIFF